MTKAGATAPDMKPVERTSMGLRDAIFDELDAIRQGRSNPTKTNAITKAALAAVEIVRVEIEAAKAADELHRAGKLTTDMPTLKPLQLGTISR